MPRSREFDIGLAFWRNVYAPREKIEPVCVEGEELPPSKDLESLGLRDSTQPLGEIYPNGWSEDQA